MTTMAEIAKQVGVSPMTVSRALKGSGRVRDDTRQRILDAARDAGFFEASQSSSLGVGGGSADFTYLRLLLVSNQSDGKPNYNQKIADGLEEILRRSGGKLIRIASTQASEIVEAARKNRVQGIVLRYELPIEMIDELRKSYAVVYGASYDHQAGVDAVYSNEHRSAALIYEKLLELGHTTIAWVGVTDVNQPRSMAGFEGLASSRLMDRISSSIHGVRHAAWANITHCQPRERKQPMLLIERDWSKQTLEDIVRHAVSEIIDLRPQPTAVVVSNDVVGVAMLKEIRRRGLGVPRDFSVVSYGGSELATEHGLATIELPFEEIAAAIPELIRRRLANPAASALSMQLETSLREDSSLGPVRRLRG